MNKHYYILRLDDYATPSFASRTKPYFGTLDDIRGLINALKASEKHRDYHAEMIAAFREYEAGNHKVTHNVAYQDVPLLEPVEVIGETILRLENYQWQHINIWDCPYNIRCDQVETHHLWLSSPEGCLRAVKARFRNLCYRGTSDLWSPAEEGFWGYPEMLHMHENTLCNRLAVAEKHFEDRKAARKDMAAFRINKDVDFTEFCNEILGDG